MRQQTTADAPRRERRTQTMTTKNSTEISQATPAPAPWGALRWMISDSLVISARHLRHLLRVPDLLILPLARTIIFVLLLALLFGGTIQVPGGGSYREFLFAGAVAQAMTFTTFDTAVGLATDRKQGLMDRFRSLPMVRSAVLIGRTLSTLIHSSILLVVVTVCGLVVGWRIHHGIFPAILGFALLLCLSYAMSWVGVFIGLSVSGPEAAQGGAMIWLFPITFLSNVFAPTDRMPVWVRTLAEWNPISSIVMACRELFGNAGAAASADAAWPMHHALPVAFGWIALLLLVVFVPLSMRKYT
jgi:ABC-2 type transport system permease protein